MADSKNKYRVYAGMDDSPPINWGTIANTISGQLQTIKIEALTDTQYPIGPPWLSIMSAIRLVMDPTSFSGEG